MDEGHCLLLASQRQHSWLLQSILAKPDSDSVQILGVSISMAFVIQLAYIMFTVIVFFATKLVG
jgi:hypothetical protein